MNSNQSREVADDIIVLNPCVNQMDILNSIPKHVQVNLGMISHSLYRFGTAIGHFH